MIKFWIPILQLSKNTRNPEKQVVLGKWDAL